MSPEALALQRLTPCARRASGRAGSGRIGVAILLGLVAVAALAPWLARDDPSAIAGDALLRPGGAHLFGTDDLGRDLFSGVVHGARSSSSSASSPLGCPRSSRCSLRRAACEVERPIRCADAVQEFVRQVPRFFLIVLIVSLFGSSTASSFLSSRSPTWPATARVFRAQVLSVLGRDFVVASRASGGSDAAILVRHVLPRAPLWPRNCPIRWGDSRGSRVELSGPGRSDGDQLGRVARGRQHFVREAWWMSVFPGIALTLTVLACN